MAVLATALACAFPAACAVPPAPPRPASHFAISFERSGGIKARVETLVVRPGLRAYATAPKGARQASKHFRMSAQTAEEVRKELAKARFTHLQSSANPSTCPDCYVYSITYRGHTVLFFEGQAKGHLGEVVDSLEQEVIDHLYLHIPVVEPE